MDGSIDTHPRARRYCAITNASYDSFQVFSFDDVDDGGGGGMTTRHDMYINNEHHHY